MESKIRGVCIIIAAATHLTVKLHILPSIRPPHFIIHLSFAVSFPQTHYHNLVQEFAGSENVTSCHMDCQVTSDDAVSGQQDVTFLYRVADGSCPKSYGFNVARMAGLPDPVVRQARQAAIRLEQKAVRRKELRRLIHQLTIGPGEETAAARILCHRIKDLSLVAASAAGGDSGRQY